MTIARQRQELLFFHLSTNMPKDVVQIPGEVDEDEIDGLERKLDPAGDSDKRFS